MRKNVSLRLVIVFFTIVSIFVFPNNKTSGQAIPEYPIPEDTNGLIIEPLDLPGKDLPELAPQSREWDNYQLPIIDSAHPQATGVPTMTAYLHYNQIRTYGWNPGVKSEVKIGLQTWEATADENGRYTLSLSPYTLKAGDVVELRNLDDPTQLVESYTVKWLSITSYDMANDTFSGKADPNLKFEVGVSTKDEPYLGEIITADANGDFTVDFSGKFDIRPGTLLSAQASAAGPTGLVIHGSYVDLMIRDPFIEAYLNDSYLILRDWKPNGSVTIRIEDLQWTVTPDVSGTAYFTIPGNAVILKPGTVITADDGEFIRSHTLFDLRITTIDKALDLLEGESLPNAKLRLYASDGALNHQYLDITSGTNGLWVANLAGKIDIMPGTYGWLKQSDIQKNTTILEWRTGNPKIEVYPFRNDLLVFGCRAKDEIKVTIGGDWLLQIANSSGYAFFNFNLMPLDIKEGTIIQASCDGATTSYTTAELSWTAVDPIADKITGKAAAGTSISVYVSTNTGIVYAPSPIVSDASGNWVADFSGVVDITRTSRGRAVIFESSGHRTAIDWYMINPQFMVYIDNSLQAIIDGERIWISSWWPERDVELTISGQTWKSRTSYNGFADFPLIDFDVEGGQVLTVSDGTNSLQYTVSSIDLEVVDIQKNLISGTGKPGSEFQLLVCLEWMCDQFQGVVGPTGRWSISLAGVTTLSSHHTVDVLVSDSMGSTFTAWRLYFIHLPLTVR